MDTEMPSTQPAKCYPFITVLCTFVVIFYDS